MYLRLCDTSVTGTKQWCREFAIASKASISNMTSKQPATLCPSKKTFHRFQRLGAGGVPPLTLMTSLSVFLGGFPAFGAISQTFHERVERLSLQLSLPSKKGRHVVIVNPSCPPNTANETDFHATQRTREKWGYKPYTTHDST